MHPQTDADSLLRMALDSPILLVVPALAVMSLLLGAAIVVARQAAAPRALVAASASGGVVVHGGPDLARLLVFADPTLAQPALRPYVVLAPSDEVLTLIIGADRAEVLWDEIRSVERRSIGFRARSALVVTFSRGCRPRSAVLRLVDEPGPLGLRSARPEEVERFRRRLLSHLRQMPSSPSWGSRSGL